MFDTKIPLTLLFAVFLQAVGLVWWVSQQSAAIERMKEDLVVLTSRATLEDNVNLKERSIRSRQRHRSYFRKYGGS
jgi:cell division protein FtsL